MRFSSPTTMSLSFPNRRLNADEEKALARRMRAAEERTRSALQGVEGIAELLATDRRRNEQTRAGMVDRLEEAVSCICALAREDKALRPRASEARRAWAEVEALRWQLAMSGRRIAHGEARKLAGRYLDEADLVQEGYIGLLRAAKRFDPNRNIRFSTYARWWVRAQMTRAIDHGGRVVRLPSCAVEQTRKLRRTLTDFERAGLPYTMADVAAEAGVDEDRARTLLAQGRAISLEEPIEDGDKPRRLESMISDGSEPDVDQLLIHQEELTRLEDAISDALTDRHRFVLSQRYGLGDKPGRTLSAIGRSMNLSRERVRQIEREALTKLRESGIIREPLNAA
ncbi:MAG: sigma-70 family RNA polymerase sigma factor [Alphaproteobacteria bacterium]|nr:sigma-70 family RNA polymerase sigma factor [Alphaproteobacteria bacterium]